MDQIPGGGTRLRLPLGSWAALFQGEGTNILILLKPLTREHHLAASSVSKRREPEVLQKNEKVPKLTFNIFFSVT